jgi:hypothetical protein
MKKLTALLGCLVLIALAGCPRTTIKPAAKTGTATKNDSRRLALELLRQPPDAARYWDALQLLNSDISQRAVLRDKLTPTADTSKAVQAMVGLGAGELQEFQYPTYRHADAYHVAECSTLRDASRAMEVSGVPLPELARHGMHWVVRQVLMHQQGDDWLPPAQVLRRGYGSSRDRVRVFLALVRQMQMEGCVFTLPDAPDEIVLIGVTGRETPSPIFLFDARCCLALETADRKIASTKDVDANPELLQRAGLTAAQFRAADVKVACPLQALPPRMRELEDTLRNQGRVSLFIDPVTLQERFKELLGRPVHVWNSPPAGDRVENSPTRALRLFLPADQGGADKADPTTKTDRLTRFQNHLLPSMSLLQALDRINLGRQVAQIAFTPLAWRIQDLLEKYDLQPRDMLLRGKGEEVVQRYERLRTFLEDENLVGLGDLPQFQRAVAEWRGKLDDAYRALAAKEPQGQAMVNNLWNEDQYLLTIANVEGEDRLAPAQGRGEDRPPLPKKTVLTAIVAYVTRDYLNQRASWMRALVWHDKAERDQQRALRAPEGSPAPANARSAWLNTRSAWNLFLDRPAVGVADRQQRLNAIHMLLKRTDERSAVEAAHLLEVLHLDLHQQFAARIQQAHAVYHLDGAKAAVLLLHNVDEQIAAMLEPGKNGQPVLKDEIDDVRQRLRPPENAAVVRSLQLVQNDWATQGNLYWLRQHIRQQIALWQQTGELIPAKDR